MTNKNQINLRVEDETLIELTKQAEKENRSRNNLIEHIIKEYLKEKNKP